MQLFRRETSRSFLVNPKFDSYSYNTVPRQRLQQRTHLVGRMLEATRSGCVFRDVL